MKKTARFLSLIAATAMLSAAAIGLTGCGLSGLRDEMSDDRYDDDYENGENRFEVVNGVVVSKVETIDGELIITYTDGTRVNLGPIATIETEQDLEFYPLSDGTYGVKMGNALYKDEVTLPDTYRGAAVTQILPDGFAGASYLRYVNIPNSVTAIGERAFEGCSSLYSITIPEKVNRIGTDAFEDCHNLSDVYVRSVETWMNIWFEDENSCPGKYATIHFVDSNGNELTDLTIPDGTSTISPYAFMGCRNLTSLTIPDSVGYISTGAFKGCSSLSIIDFPDKLTEIGEYAFADCPNLTSVTIPDTVEYLGRGVFSGCSNLSSLVLPFLGYSRYSMENAYLGYTFGAYDADENNSYVPYSLTSVQVTGGNEIGYRAFADCSGLTSITIPETVSYIGSEAFYYCSSLASFTIPSSVSVIGESAFYGCNSLTDIVVPNNVSTIGYSAFSGCYSLQSMTLPFVGESRDGYNVNFGYIFGTSYGYENNNYVPSSLTSVIITDAYSIGNEAFRGCGNLISVILPATVTFIGDGAFSECNSLTEMLLPDGVQSIGSAAFSNCSSMTLVSIPYSVGTIGDNAFAYCSNLSNLYYGGSEYDWEYVSKGYDWNWETNFTISFNQTLN